MQGSEWTLPYYSLILLWIGSLVALSVGAAREGAVPVWGALLFSAFHYLGPLGEPLQL